MYILYTKIKKFLSIKPLHMNLQILPFLRVYFYECLVIGSIYVSNYINNMKKFIGLCSRSNYNNVLSI